MQDTRKREGDNRGAGVQDAKSGDNTPLSRSDVRRIVAQIVEAAANSVARAAAAKCRQMMCDESPARVPSGGNAWYIAGRNDVLRELAKSFDARVEGALVEAVARDAEALATDVEVVYDEEAAIGCAYPCAECGRCCCANVVARSRGRR